MNSSVWSNIGRGHPENILAPTCKRMFYFWLTYRYKWNILVVATFIHVGVNACCPAGILFLTCVEFLEILTGSVWSISQCDISLVKRRLLIDCNLFLHLYLKNNIKMPPSRNYCLSFIFSPQVYFYFKTDLSYFIFFVEKGRER